MTRLDPNVNVGAGNALGIGRWGGPLPGLIIGARILGMPPGLRRFMPPLFFGRKTVYHFKVN